MSDRRGDRVGSFTTELTLAVELRDALTGGSPREQPRVALANADHEFLRNPSGYHVLVDVPPDPPTLSVVVESDAYLRATESVDRSTLGRVPLRTIDLVPAPAYPFGGGVTLVRGVVEEGDEPVADAAVSFVQGEDATRTTPEGEFALAITDFGADDVTTTDDSGVSNGGNGGGGNGGTSGNGNGGGGNGGNSGGGNSGNGNAGNGNSGNAGNGGQGNGGSNGDASDGTRIIEPGGQSPTVRATHPDGRTTEQDVTLPVGGTASVTLGF